MKICRNSTVFDIFLYSFTNHAKIFIHRLVSSKALTKMFAATVFQPYATLYYIYIYIYIFIHFFSVEPRIWIFSSAAHNCIKKHITVRNEGHQRKKNSTSLQISHAIPILLCIVLQEQKGLSISFGLISLPLELSCDCCCASKTTLKDMGELSLESLRTDHISSVTQGATPRVVS